MRHSQPESSRAHTFSMRDKYWANVRPRKSVPQLQIADGVGRTRGYSNELEKVRVSLEAGRHCGEGRAGLLGGYWRFPPYPRNALAARVP